MAASSPVVDELECRVCRGSAEPDRPLFYPCLCSGSIMYCHQDCLEQWLSHSKKDKCEVCDSKYRFTTVYMDDAPSIVPIYRLLTSGLKIVFVRFIPLVLRVLLALCMWLCVVSSNLSKFILDGLNVKQLYSSDFPPPFEYVYFFFERCQ